MPSILERELVVITGKGGVGRSMLAAAAGLASSGPDHSTVICETAGQSAVASILGHRPAPVGTITGLANGLACTTIDPDAALREWMGSQIGSTLSRVLGGSRSFGQFIAAAPGARELVTITKAWELGPGRTWQRGSDDHQTVILDAPATGHGVAMLRAPHTFAEIAGAGPIHDQAAKVRDLLADPARSAIVAVTIPSELPVGETLDLSGWLRETLGRGLDLVVANRCSPFTLDDSDVALVRSAVTSGAVPEAAARLSEGLRERTDAERTLISDLGSAAGTVLEVPEYAADVPLDLMAARIADLLADGLDPSA